MAQGKRPRMPNYGANQGAGDKRDEDVMRRKNLRAAIDDRPLYNDIIRNKKAESHAAEPGYARLRNERLDRLEQPLIANAQWRDVFSRDPSFGKPPSPITGPWQVSAFAFLGVIVVLSAIFLHMVAENGSDQSQRTYSNYRRRQRYARRAYKTRKKKTDEWSDDEEELQNGVGIPDLIDSVPGAGAQFYPYYDQAPAANPAFATQGHRQRRTSYTAEPETPPRGVTSGSGGSTYYMPVGTTYKSPSVNIMNMSGIHRRGISPRNSFSSNKSGARSPGPSLRPVTTSIGENCSGGAPSPSHMRNIAPLSGRQRVPSTPEGKDLFPTIQHTYSSTSINSGLHAFPQTLPTQPEGSQLSMRDAQKIHVTQGGTVHELGARPLNSSNFSSFASTDGSVNEHSQQGRRRVRSGSLNKDPLSGSLHTADIFDTSIKQDSHGSQRLYESHQQSLLLTPGNYEAETPQIGNVRKHSIRDDDLASLPNLNSALLPQGGNGNPMPLIPTLQNFRLDSESESGDLPFHYAPVRPPRSILIDELRIIQMETGNSMQWGVKEFGCSPEESNSTVQGDDMDGYLQGDGYIEDSSQDDGSDIPIPSNDPRGGIVHKRVNLTMDTDAYKSLQSNINFEDLKLGEVIGGGGFGQVWRATWFGTPVAVKVLTGSAQSQHIAKPILEEFKAEINLLKGMRHPNICLYMGACVKPPNRAIVTELATNGSVWDALRLPLAPPYVAADGTARGAWPQVLYAPGQHGAPPTDLPSPRVLAPIPPKGSWPWQLVKRVARGSAAGMTYLHHGKPPILHRDLKSANLLLDDSYTAKVCDFGLSRLKAQTRSMTGNCGTVQWMAPEVLANEQYDEKADVFSYGIILWELLSQECPYEGMTAIQCALAVLNRDKRPEIPKWCPPGFHALIKSCVKKDPSARPSFAQVIEILDAMEA